MLHRRREGKPPENQALKNITTNNIEVDCSTHDALTPSIECAL